MSVERSLRREDWERATVAAIGDGGLAAVRIDELSQRLGVTKGSFYWHFDTRDELIDAALVRWRDACLACLERFAAIPAPRARLRAVAESSLREVEAGRVEVALGGVVDDERVTPFLEAVVQRRLALFEDAFRELATDEPTSRLADLSLLAHAIYIGYLHTVRVDLARRRAPSDDILPTWLALFERDIERTRR